MKKFLLIIPKNDLFHHGNLKLRYAAVFLACRKGALRELGMIRRVGIILSFKADSGIFNERHTALAEDTSVKEIARVNLYARQIRIKLQLSAADGLKQSRVRLALNVIEAEIVVVTQALNELFIGEVYPLAYLVRSSEVKGCSLRRADFTRRNTVRVCRGKAVGIQLQNVGKYGALC